MAGTARPRIRAIKSNRPSVDSAQERALRAIAATIEKHMNDEGMDEKEKNSRVAIFAAMVDEEISAKRMQSATPLKHH
jgi:N-acetylglucosamine kinase-like BadF-type ATPase